MRKETDLGGVKAIAKALLMTAVNQTPYSPILVRTRITNDYDVRRAAMFLKLLRYSYSSSGKSYASQPFDIRKLFELIRLPALNPNTPVGMSTEKLGIRGNHFGLVPNTEFKPLGVHLLYKLA